jgi:hypothetical protein
LWLVTKLSTCLGAKLEDGAKWTADEVKKAVSELGSEIESLGGGS